MRRILAILPVLVAGILAASLAGAQPGIGITKSTNLQGRGSSGSPLDLAPSIVVAVDITAGDDITATDRITTDKLYIPPSATSWLSVPFINLFPTLEPTALPAGVTTDWFPTDFTWRSLIYVTPNAAGSTLASLRENTSGDFRILINASTTASITLTHEHLASTDVKRISCPGAVDCAIPPGGTAFLVYAKQRYRVVGLAGAGDIEGVTAGNGLTGGGTTGTVTLDVAVGTGLSVAADAVNLNMAGASCVAGSYMSALTATGAGTCLAEVGDISNITAGNGLTGDTGTGAATLAVGCSTGITCAADAISVDTAAIQARVTGTCVAGSSIRVIDALGAVTCETDDSGGGVTGSGTVGTVPRWVTSTTNLGNSSLTDDGTNATATGALAVNGNATVGNADTDEHTINGKTTIRNQKWPTSAHSLTASTNDIAFASMSTTSVINITATGNWQITGIAGGEDGRRLILNNVGASQFTLVYDSGSSTAGNRIRNGWYSTLTVEQYNTVTLVYADSRWQVLDKSGRFIPQVYASEAFVSYGPSTMVGNVTLGDADTDVVSFTGYPSFDVNMKGIKDATPAPSISATNGACGTGATVTTGGNFAFTITTGSAAGTCVATFPDAFGAAPTCVVQCQSTARTFSYAVTASAITISTVESSTKYDVICVGH